MSIKSSTNCSKMAARMSNCSSQKLGDSVSKPDRSSSNSPCSSNSKHPSKYAVHLATFRRHTRTIPRFDKAFRICWVSGRYELPVSGRLCGPWKTINRNNMSHAGIQDKKPLEFLHAARQPRMLQYQPHLWLLR